MKTLVSIVTLSLTLILSAGCQKPEPPAASQEYQTVAVDPQRDTDAARRFNAAGVAMLKDSQLDAAETEFKAALKADMFFGPAHNNLGMVYHRQKKLYLAAWEFQYASTLMPNRAEPRNNLGAVFEAVGKLDDAAEWYEAALQIEPDTPEVISNLARIYVREKRTDTRTRELLSEIVLKDHRSDLVEWAREQLAMMPKTDSAEIMTLTPAPEPETK